MRGGKELVSEGLDAVTDRLPSPRPTCVTACQYCPFRYRNIDHAHPGADADAPAERVLHSGVLHEGLIP
ncbi:hypothetical protein ACFU6S_44590, partial [Streptomyces sp. NPDC057456]